MTATTDTLRGGVTNSDDIPDTMDLFLAGYGIAKGSPDITTTSGTATAYTGASLAVTLTANQIIEIQGMILCSCGTSTAITYMQLFRDSTALGDDMQHYEVTGNTSGKAGMLFQTHIEQPGAGSYTYTIKWNVSAGTAYSRSYILTAKKFLYA